MFLRIQEHKNENRGFGRVGALPARLMNLPLKPCKSSINTSPPLSQIAIAERYGHNHE